MNIDDNDTDDGEDGDAEDMNEVECRELIDL